MKIRKLKKKKSTGNFWMEFLTCIENSKHLNYFFLKLL